MTRVKKQPVERRAELLDCAQALFFTQGYEATTVNDILARARLSKGAFYHYFESKEALLDALIERLAAQFVVEAEAILDNPELDALARLNAFLAQGRQWKIERAPMLRAILEAVLKTENAALYQRMLTATARVIAPVLTRLVEEGVRGRVFDAPAPGLVAEVIIKLGETRQAVIVETFAEAERGDLEGAARRLEARLADETAMIERLLGVAPGAVTMVEPGFVRAMLQAMC
ncbi:MAG: TetR/AcrR family transcriptional regulator [Phenylobacterium sp.]|uniref:TetR/AcrR family transcriptional regulator n=1 Tax=Phenylobacterium sp. TaxID=1871053 RepID=UPI00391A585B